MNEMHRRWPSNDERPFDTPVPEGDSAGCFFWCAFSLWLTIGTPWVYFSDGELGLVEVLFAAAGLFLVFVFCVLLLMFLLWPLVKPTAWLWSNGRGIALCIRRWRKGRRLGIAEWSEIERYRVLDEDPD